MSWRRAKAAAAEVEHERTRQVARIGNNLNQIARWANTYASEAEAGKTSNGPRTIENFNPPTHDPSAAMDLRSPRVIAMPWNR